MNIPNEAVEVAANRGGEMNRLLCWFGLHKIHYTWKTKMPYCARSEGCKGGE